MSIKWKVGDKLTLQNTGAMIEIVSILPGAQGVKLDLGNINHYSVIIDGYRTYISEPVLEILIKQLDFQENAKKSHGHKK